MQTLLPEIRARLNVSQEELARMIGVSFATVNRWENGHSRPNKAVQLRLYDICKEHDVNLEEILMQKIQITVSGSTLPIVLEDNGATRALVDALRKAPITYTARDYGGFEKVGALGRSLPASDSQMTTQAGDVILYSGNQIVLFYGSNTWSYTRLGKIRFPSLDVLKRFLKAGGGDVSVTLSL